MIAQVKKALNSVFPHVFILKGLEKHSQLPLSFAYAGTRSLTLEYWAQTALAPGFQEISAGRRWYKSLIKGGEECHFLLVEAGPWTLKFFSKRPGFHLPRWITMDMDISASIEKLLGSQRAEISRRIRHHQLTYAMSGAQADFDDFYDNMYLPYIQSRYKNTAMVNPRRRLLEIFRKGQLVLIKKDGLAIAGGLIEFMQAQAYFRMMGLRDGKQEYAKIGAIGAIYYFMTVEMKKKGYRNISLGTSRPLLSDGLTQFKKSIGGRLVDDHSERVWLKLVENSSGLQSFLTHNPFIFYKGDQPCCAVFTASTEERTKALQVTACGGVAQTDVFIFSEASYRELFPDGI